MITIVEIKPIIQKHIKGCCKLRYKGHKNGCPNYNNPKVKRCPSDDPQLDTPMFDEVYDMEKPFYAIINSFDLGTHAANMKALHKEWSDRQCRCVLYWQPKARKQLKQGIIDFLKTHKEYHVTTCPEGMGVNVTQTLKKAGFKLEWPAKNTACQVAFAGIRRKSDV